MKTFLTHPVVVFLVTLTLLSGGALAYGVQITKITEIAIYTLYGAGVNLLLGYTGLVPFGASVFFGLASYAAAIVALQMGGPEILGLAFAILFSASLGLVLGAVVLRRRGLYFSLLTLACSQLAYEIVFKWTSVTGGENGLQNVPRTWFPSDLSFHIFAVVTVALAMLALWRVIHAPFGRTLQAIRENEQRVICLGYNSYRYKLGSFVLSACFVGYAGALLAFMLQGAYANNLNWQQAGDALLMTVLGGVHHFLGPLWGSLAFILLTDQLSALLEQWWLAFAPIIIIFVLVSPEGLYGLWQRLRGSERWTLIRREIPPRPAQIVPFRSDAAKLDPSQPLLSVKNLSKSFGSLVTARDISLDVMPYQLHSFIGPNGAGKTTFFNMLTGLLRPNGGTILFRGEDITRMSPNKRIRNGIARSFQIISLFPQLTAFENVRVAVQSGSPSRRGLWRNAYDFEEVNARTWSLLAAVGLEDRAAELCLNLAHGEQRLLDIAMALAANGSLLLLDEPLAGLADADREVVGRLIRSLASSHAVLLIEHDIDRVLSLSDRVTVLHQGRLIADGPPRQVAADPAVVAAYLGDTKIDQMRAVGGKHQAPGEVLLEIAGVSAGYEGSTVLDGISLTVREGEVVALLGRNGVGKTTLLRAISGVVAKQKGQISFAGDDITALQSFEINQLGIAIVPEGRRLFPNLTVLENLEIAARPGGASLDEVYDIFPKLKILRRSRAESLSGGERQMVAIARALMAPTKLILLDEPFEGLAPAIVQEVMVALLRLRERASVLIVEHKAELILPICDRAYAMVNGKVAWAGSAQALNEDENLKARLLGVVEEAA
jgi:ABC-type branched-subunit amino acid transport system ATPase component/ABC-type branched-subunit amino acid transport system permease subunit